MLKHFPQTHQASSMLVPSISFPFQITAYLPIHYHSTSKRHKFISKHIQQCLESCWTPPLPPKFGKNYKTVLTDYLNKYCTIFTLFKTDTKNVWRNSFLLARIICIHSFHNLTHVLLSMQITLASLYTSHDINQFRSAL